MDDSLHEENRDNLISKSHSQEPLLISKSIDEILVYSFGKVLPVLRVNNSDAVMLAFSHLQKSWDSEYLVETETDLIADIIRQNLERCTKNDNFSCFDVIIGTEADEKSVLYWRSRVNDQEFKILSQVQFMQINAIIGTTFRGYRIWKVRYEQGNQATALAAMANSILL
jgi:hypothetical protein